jgi:hypothetical protein
MQDQGEWICLAGQESRKGTVLCILSLKVGLEGDEIRPGISLEKVLRLGNVIAWASTYSLVPVFEDRECLSRPACYRFALLKMNCRG